MSRTKKVLLPRSHPLWKVVEHEMAMRRPGAVDPRVEEAITLANDLRRAVREYNNNANAGLAPNELKLRDKDGNLRTVVIPSLE